MNNQSLYIKDNKHNYLGLFFGLFTWLIAIIYTLAIIKYQLGYLLLVLPFFILLFAILKIIRSITLSINLNKKYNKFNIKRLNIYIFENWHKKLIGNFWIYLLFCFLITYSTIIYLIFFFILPTTSLWVSFSYWKVMLINFAILILITIIYRINYFYLKRIIVAEQNHLQISEINLHEINLINKSVKNDYKYFVLFIAFSFLILPYFLLFSKKIQNYLKKI